MEAAELFDLCQRGDGSGFEALYRTYYRDVYSAARRVVGDPVLAQDVTQEAFIKAFRHIGSVRDGEALPAWLRRVACREAYTLLRRSPILRHALALDDDLITAADPTPGPDTAAEDGERCAAVRRGLRRLGPEMRQVLELYYFEHRPVEEIARLLRCPDGTIKSRLYRARQALRRHLPPSLSA